MKIVLIIPSALLLLALFFLNLCPVHAADAPIPEMSLGAGDGVPWPKPRFIDHGNGTVTDRLTGLMWMKSANCIGEFHPSYDFVGTAGDGRVTYILASGLIYHLNVSGEFDCNCTSDGRYTDWRIPNVRELYSLFDPSQTFPQYLPAGHPFTSPPIMMGGTYWTRTPSMRYANMYLSVNDLCEIVQRPSDDNLYVWPVRGTSTKSVTLFPFPVNVE
jgi:hypothetical protein